jgi:hypothetical protein
MLAAILLCWATQPAAAGQAATDYVRGLVRDLRSSEAALEEYVYDLTEVREELDRHGRTTKRRLLRYEVFHVRGRPVRRLVEEDNQPLPSTRQREEDARVRDEVEAIADGRAEARRPGLRLSTILERYAFEEVSQEEIRGRRARVFDFRADPGEREEDGRDDDVLLTLAGRIWVDQSDHRVVRAQVYSDSGLPIDLGMLGALSELGFELSFRKVDDEVWLPSTLRTFVAGRKLINKFRRRRTLIFEHFRRVEVDASESLRF